MVYYVAMHIDIVPNRGARPAYLLRESYREGGRVHKRTLAIRQRDLVLAMVASLIVAPHTKLATTRWWHTTTLAEDFGVAEASEDDLYAAMDWLLGHQGAAPKKLAAAT